MLLTMFTLYISRYTIVSASKRLHTIFGNTDWKKIYYNCQIFILIVVSLTNRHSTPSKYMNFLVEF